MSKTYSTEQVILALERTLDIAERDGWPRIRKGAPDAAILRWHLEQLKAQRDWFPNRDKWRREFEMVPPPDPCGECKGSGEVSRKTGAYGSGIQFVQDHCPACKGSGKAPTEEEGG